MKLSDLKAGVREYLYLEDTGSIDAIMASTLAFRLNLGDPAWLVIVGPSSGGKSQLLRPLALAGEGYVHTMDDITENAFLSGAAGEDKSFLKQMGKEGIILMSDMTVLFSKHEESRSTIFSQLRMLYDGKMSKRSGNRKETIEWDGRAMLIGGSTASIYPVFQRTADMGERFLYYSLKPFDPVPATQKTLENRFAKKVDEKIADLYREYQIDVFNTAGNIEIPELGERTKKRVLDAALFAARLRTPVMVNERSGLIERVPIPEMPMRVARQLQTMALGMSAMQFHETGSYEISDDFLETIEWCAYSLGDNERRGCLAALAADQEPGTWYSTQQVADKVGLDTPIVRGYLQALAAAEMIDRQGDLEGTLNWSIRRPEDHQFVRDREKPAARQGDAY